MVQVIPRPGDMLALRDDNTTLTWTSPGITGRAAESWTDSSIALVLGTRLESADFVWVDILLHDTQRAVLWNVRAETEMRVVET